MWARLHRLVHVGLEGRLPGWCWQEHVHTGMIALHGSAGTVCGSEHRFSYSTLETISPKVEGLMLRSSRSLYRLCRNFSRWYLRQSCAT